MTRLTVHRTTDASAAQIWEVLSNLERSAAARSSVIDITRLDDGATFDVGTRWKETRTLFGREASEIMEITALDPGRSYTTTAGGPGVTYISTMSIDPSNDGTNHLTMTFTGEATSAIAKVLSNTIGKLFEGATKKAAEKDLDEIVAAAEASGSAPN